MHESNVSTPSLPAKRKSGQFQKGRSGNPGGRGKGNLSKTTKFLQIMTGERQKKALKVLDAVIKAAEGGDADSRKLVLTLIQPFLKREAEKEMGGKNKRPLVVLNVGVAEGHKARVIDGRTGEVEE